MAWMGKCVDLRHDEPCELYLHNTIILMVGQKKLSPDMPWSGYTSEWYTQNTYRTIYKQ